MSTRCSNASAAAFASSTTVVSRRKPQPGSRRRRSASNADVPRRRRLAVDEIRPVEHERAAGHEALRGALHQRRAGRPLGDVQHVGAIDRVERPAGGQAAQASSASGGRRWPARSREARSRGARRDRSAASPSRTGPRSAPRAGRSAGDLEHGRHRQDPSAHRGSVPCCARRPDCTSRVAPPVRAASMKGPR